MATDVKTHQRFPWVHIAAFEDGTTRLATKNLVVGRQVYGERLVSFKDVEYRIWDPFRSKLAAAILKGLVNVPIKGGSLVLYLGAASGTTASHISDIVGRRGHVYCVEFAARTIRELVNNVCTHRDNMTPILGDARRPEEYGMFVETVDVVYCDVAQPKQAKILADNADAFLRKNGWAMLAVKSQSIDVTKEPHTIYKKEAKMLKSRGFTLMEILELEPYDKAHAMIVSKI